MYVFLSVWLAVCLSPLSLSIYLAIYLSLSLSVVSLRFMYTASFQTAPGVDPTSVLHMTSDENHQKQPAS